MYDELYCADKKNGTLLGMYGQNVVQSNYIFYCLYKILGNEQKSMKHAKLAHKFYMKNTLCYHWENIAYMALKEVYGDKIVPDCILPNNSKPDLVVNPTYNTNKYHPRGWRIIKADKIIDMKTSLYGTSKEINSYIGYCEKLIIIHLQDEAKQNNPEITYLSADQLRGMLKSQKVITEIANLQAKSSLAYLVNNFNNRCGDSI